MTAAARTSDLPQVGHRNGQRPRSPFGSAAPSIAIALAYAVAALVWVVAGRLLPGGRWLAVHLFTLGVLTNVVLVFSEHFGRTLTRARAGHGRWQPGVLNVGVLLVLVGIASGTRWATTSGGLVVTGVVTSSWWRLRRLRREAVGARFAWVVRTYERAHGAFLHGAVLGLLLGLGVLGGSWYGAARVAHLHVNVAGWGGLTLLATLVFFGPTMVRTRIVAGADGRAAPALRRGATGLTVAVLLLLATGTGGAAAVPLRVAAATAMSVYAVAVTVVCVPVATAAWRTTAPATRWPVIATSWWFVAAAWCDVAVVASGAWRLLDAVGLAMLLGVLGQSVTATLAYLAPLLRAATAADRERVRARLATGGAVRSAVANSGTLAVVVAAVVRGPAGSVLGRSGWGLVVTSVVWLVAAGLLPAAGRSPAATVEP